MIKCQLFSEKVEHTYTQSIHKHIHHYLLFSLSLFLLFVFWGFFCCTCKFPDQGSNLHHSCDLHQRCGNAESLTCSATQEFPSFFFFFFPKYLPLWKQKLSLPCSQNKFVFVLSFNMPMRNFSTTL